MGCSKDDDPGSSVPATGTRAQQTQDSLFLYAAQTYLWYDQLPDYKTFDPRKYTGGSDIVNLRKELLALTQYAVNPDTKRPYEFVSNTSDHAKYSFIEEADGSASGRLGDLLEGTGNDYGFALTAIGTSDIRVRYVIPGSTASVKGLVRGDQLLTLNGTTVNTSQVNQINAAFDSPTMTVSLRRKDGSTYNTTLTQGSYTTSTLYKPATVLRSGNRVVGYFAMAAFSTLKNTQKELDAAFTTFAGAGVTDLIIDLRYNGGGYVETAQYLLDLIIPTSHHNAVSYVERYNKLMQEGKATILSKQLLRDGNNDPVKYGNRYATYADVDYSEAKNTYHFVKKGSLENVRSVCFIMTGASASASELTANALRPYMDVKIIGSQSYGKPVGFFGITIDKYTAYLSNFQISNSKGEGNYYNGLTPDIAAADDVTRDFGDSEETSIATAMSYITTGLTTGGREETGRVMQFQHIGKATPGFQGMIEQRIHLK